MELLSGEVAKLLGVHPITIGRMVEDGRLKCRINSSGWRMFDAQSVVALKKKMDASPSWRKKRMEVGKMLATLKEES